MISKSNRRYLRSVLMLVAAMGLLVWAAVDLFNIPTDEISVLFLAVAVGSGLIIVVAALFLLLAKVIRKLLAKVRHR